MMRLIARELPIECELGVRMGELWDMKTALVLKSSYVYTHDILDLFERFGKMPNFISQISHLDCSMLFYYCYCCFIFVFV